MSRDKFSSVFKITFSYVAGFLFTNLSFSYLAAPTVETIKTSETVTSVLLSVACYASSVDPFPTILELLSMMPIVFGVFLATYSDFDLVPIGVACVLVANLSFSLRGSFLKQHKFHFRQVRSLVRTLNCGREREREREKDRARGTKRQRQRRRERQRGKCAQTLSNMSIQHVYCSAVDCALNVWFVAHQDSVGVQTIFFWSNVLGTIAGTSVGLDAATMSFSQAERAP